MAGESLSYSLVFRPDSSLFIYSFVFVFFGGGEVQKQMYARKESVLSLQHVHMPVPIYFFT